ncbi:MAG: hypothetical protein MZV64_71055 [Ignavibacteriales bacterium]|nr:hypothetical protein [Ignavibacteriales bacterium]
MVEQLGLARRNRPPARGFSSSTPARCGGHGAGGFERHAASSTAVAASPSAGVTVAAGRQVQQHHRVRPADRPAGRRDDHRAA